MSGSERPGTTGLSLFQKILQLLKAPGGPLQPPDAACKDRSGVFQYSPGASWDFGESPLISLRRSRLTAFLEPPRRCSSESRLAQDYPDSVCPALSLPGSPALRRCVWALPPENPVPGRASPPPRLEYLTEPEDSPPPRDRSEQTRAAPPRPVAASKRRHLEVHRHRRWCGDDSGVVVVWWWGATSPFVHFYT